MRDLSNVHILESKVMVRLRGNSSVCYTDGYKMVKMDKMFIGPGAAHLKFIHRCK